MGDYYNIEIESVLRKIGCARTIVRRLEGQISLVQCPSGLTREIDLSTFNISVQPFFKHYFNRHFLVLFVQSLVESGRTLHLTFNISQKWSGLLRIVREAVTLCTLNIILCPTVFHWGEWTIFTFAYVLEILFDFGGI